MQITYTTTHSDSVYAQDYLLHRGKKSSKMLIWIILAFVFLLSIASMLASEMRPHHHSDPKVMYMIVVLPFILIPIIYALISINNKLNAKSKPALEHTIVITPSVLIHRALGEEVSYEWKHLYDIAEDARMIYIFPSKDGLIIVPKNTFPGVEETQAFYRQTCSYWKAEEQSNDEPATSARPDTCIQYRVNEADLRQYFHYWTKYKRPPIQKYKWPAVIVLLILSAVFNL